MMNYNPVTALFIFTGISLLLFLLFRPTKGWFWLVKSSINTNKRIITEDILKKLYHFENENKKVDMNVLTATLKFKNEHIVNVIKNMMNQELIYGKDTQLKLTPQGREYAIKIVRVHRLWEKYLAEKTGFDKSEWHSLAEEMEHKLSHEEINDLANNLGNPLYDPHGDPIPTEKGKVLPLKGRVLTSLDVNTTGRIIHIEDEPEVIYRRILKHNIHIDSEIKIIENNKDKVVFLSEGEKFSLAPIVAANIMVTVNNENIIVNKEWSKLSMLRKNEEAKIVGISKECRGENRRRLLDLGFVKGANISIDLLNPLKNPKAYKIKGTSIALRNEQASKILIKKNK